MQRSCRRCGQKWTACGEAEPEDGAVVLEPSSDVVHSIFAVHRRSSAFDRIVRHRDILGGTTGMPISHTRLGAARLLRNISISLNFSFLVGSRDKRLVTGGAGNTERRW